MLMPLKVLLLLQFFINPSIKTSQLEDLNLFFFPQTFSLSKQWKEYCLAHLFTYQDFADGVIGLAYVGNPKRNAVGGICTEGNLSEVIFSCYFQSGSFHLRY